MSELRLYSCGGCGMVSVRNFRDSCCPVCKVCMMCDEHIITMTSPWGCIETQPAPHTSRTDDV
jgi:hypothetical protein